MAGNPLTDPKWAPQLADTVEHYVGLDSAVWVSYLLMGAILIAAGALLMRKRSVPDEVMA